MIPSSKSFGLNLKSQFSNLITAAWYTLRGPRTTVVLVGVLVVMVLLGWLIPQQSTSIVTDTTRDTWIATLPSLVQLWGEPLFLLGFSRLFRSIWFWGPLALLLLNGLVALADYGPGSWQRLRHVSPSLKWQHPLARRVEYPTRLPDSPDQFLETVVRSLQKKGFYLYESAPTDEYIISLAWRRWAWLGPLALYVGVVVWIIALLLSSYLLQSDSFTLLPDEPKTSSLFAGEFELVSMNVPQNLQTITFRSTENEQPPPTLTWRLYQPTLFKGAFILPAAISPILTVEAREAGGALLRLIPSQENLAPAEQLHLPLDAANSPLYFLIPSAGLAFQIRPDPTSENRYHVQVRRGSESAPSIERAAQAGEVFKVDDFSLLLSRQYNLKVLVHRDPALPLYIVGLILVAIGGVFIFGQPPLQLWLIAEVKGRGGQLYSVVEKFGPGTERAEFLDQILNSVTKGEP